MNRRVLLDTGPLVAFLNRRDKHHVWTLEQWAVIEPPLLTCESVLAEACFLLRSHPTAQTAIMDLLRRGVVGIPFRVEDHVEPIALLMKKYADIPISLADACLVRMVDVIEGSCVLTLDSDFTFYRKANRTVVPVIMPKVGRLK